MPLSIQSNQPSLVAQKYLTRNVRQLNQSLERLSSGLRNNSAADDATGLAISERLRADGIYFAGIDVLGDYLTEVNVTSPTGIQEMSRFDGQDYSQQWVQWQEERWASRAKRSG